MCPTKLCITASRIKDVFRATVNPNDFGCFENFSRFLCGTGPVRGVRESRVGAVHLNTAVKYGRWVVLRIVYGLITRARSTPRCGGVPNSYVSDRPGPWPVVPRAEFNV